MISPETLFEHTSLLFDWASKNTSVKSRMLSESNVNRCSSIISTINWRNFSKWSVAWDAELCQKQDLSFYQIKCYVTLSFSGKVNLKIMAPIVPNHIWKSTVYCLGNAHQIYIHTNIIPQLIRICLTFNARCVSISRSVSYLQGMYLPSMDLLIHHNNSLWYYLYL